MLNVLKLLVFVLAVVMLSCADYKELNLSVTYGSIKDDRDGRVYKTVIIGEQEWMAENLKYNKDNSIGICYEDPKVDDPDKDSDTTKCIKYGRLYTWIEAMNINNAEFNYKHYNETTNDTIFHGICPEGSHLPSFNEWNNLFHYIGVSNGGDKLKTVNDWNPPGTNEYGFSAMPAGDRMLTNTKYMFRFLGTCGAWWSSTESFTTFQILSYQICEEYNSKGVLFEKASWASIRCIKD